MLIDTHCHLDEQSFETDLDDVLSRAREQGLEAILTIGVTQATSAAAVMLAKQHPMIHAVVGIQPNYVAETGPDDFDLIAALASDPHVVAVGETGLDLYWDSSPLELQEEYFQKHITLSQHVNKPFIVHCRDAETQVVSSLRRAANDGYLVGVMHSFAGSLETARACLDLGMWISFSGMVTYKSNQALRDVAAEIPLDKILVETDAPYLAPVPMRGKRNEPAYVAHTARCLAEIHGLDLETFSRHVTLNSRELFQLAAPSA